MKTLKIVFLLIFIAISIKAENGHQLWLYNQIPKPVKIICSKQSETLNIARQELIQGWQGSPGEEIILTVKYDKAIEGDGYRLDASGVQANTDLGILYGVYELLRRQKAGQAVNAGTFNPSYKLRLLNHWDNLDGTIERGYAGNSIFWRDEKDSLTVTEQDKMIEELSRLLEVFTSGSS